MLENEVAAILRIIEFLKSKVSQKQLPVQFVEEDVRLQHNWVYLHALVRNEESASKKAQILQDLEDEWNDQEPEPANLLLLIPAAK